MGVNLTNKGGPGIHMVQRTKHSGPHGVELGLFLVPLDGELLPKGLLFGLLGDAFRLQHIVRFLPNFFAEVNL